LLLKESHEINLALKSKNNDNREECEKRLEEIRLENKNFLTRTICIGSDRYYKEYFFFP
jgi:hypothetical protein